MEKLNLSRAESEDSSETERVYLGKTKDGVRVFNRTDDETHLHSEGGLTPELVESALLAIDSGGRDFIRESVKFDHVIGGQACVDVGPEDEIVMVIRGDRGLPTPMVKNREPKPTDSVTVVMKKEDAEDEGGFYEIRTAYIGEPSPREPWDPSIKSREEQKRCQDFWDSHALLFDENDRTINWEATKEFNKLSDEEKRLKVLERRVLYAGLFVNPEELYGTIPPTLERSIEHPHVTTSYKPGVGQFHLEQLGSGARVIAIGYGNNGKNEGLLVKVEADDPVIQEACDALETPHITLSVSRDGRPKDTAFLKFTPLEKPFEITGEYGLFCQGDIVVDRDELDL